jgi:hypothetical protein
MRRIPTPRPKQVAYSPQDTRDTSTPAGAAQVNEEFRRIAADLSSIRAEKKEAAGNAPSSIVSPMPAGDNGGGGTGGGGTGGGGSDTGGGGTGGGTFAFSTQDTPTVSLHWQSNVLRANVKPNSIGLQHLTNQVRSGVQMIMPTPTIDVKKLNSGSSSILQTTRMHLRVDETVESAKEDDVSTYFTPVEYTEEAPLSGISLPVKFKDSDSVTFDITAEGEVTAEVNGGMVTPNFGLSWNEFDGRLLDVNIDKGSLIITTGDEPDSTGTFQENFISLKNDRTAPGNLKYYGTDDSGEKGWHAVPQPADQVEVKNSIVFDVEDGKAQLMGDLQNVPIYRYYGTGIAKDNGFGVRTWQDTLKMPFWKMYGNTVEELGDHLIDLQGVQNGFEHFVGIKDVTTSSMLNYAAFSLGVENDWYMAMFPQHYDSEKTAIDSDSTKFNLRRGIALNLDKIKRHSLTASYPADLLAIVPDSVNPKIGYVSTFPRALMTPPSYSAGAYLRQQSEIGGFSFHVRFLPKADVVIGGVTTAASTVVDVGGELKARAVKAGTNVALSLAGDEITINATGNPYAQGNGVQIASNVISTKIKKSLSFDASSMQLTGDADIPTAPAAGVGMMIYVQEPEWRRNTTTSGRGFSLFRMRPFSSTPDIDALDDNACGVFIYRNYGSEWLPLNAYATMLPGETNVGEVISIKNTDSLGLTTGGGTVLSENAEHVYMRNSSNGNKGWVPTNLASSAGAGRVPMLYLNGLNGGTNYTLSGIYASIPCTSTIIDEGISYNGVDSGIFSHQIPVGMGGVYKVTLHVEIKVTASSLSMNVPTRLRFDLTQNNNNVGIMTTALASAANDSVDMVEGIPNDNADDARFEDRFTTATAQWGSWYGRTILRDGFGLVNAVAGDVIRIRMYLWSWTREVPETTMELYTHVSIRPRILVEKIW